MAETRRRNVNSIYAANGSAAYDRAYLLRSSALPRQPELPEQPRPELPEENPAAKKPRLVRVRAKTVFSPFAVVGLATVAVMLFMMISAYVRLYETTTEVSELSDSLEQMQNEQAALMTQYESRIDLSHIEQMAASELSMTKPGSDQTVYVNLAGPDRAEVITSDKAEKARTVWQAFSESVADLLSDLKAYFR